MSAARAPAAPAFVVIGGGASGLFYLRQLRRARAAARLSVGRVIVVDRDAACAAAAEQDGLVSLAAADWSAWLSANLDGLDPADQLVPYHWAPHLLVEWLAARAARAGARVRRVPHVPPQGTPFDRATAAGDRALSYATWTCPPTCIEPALCPHTRGAKDWSLAALLERPRAGEESIVFRCLHLAFGVGTVPVGAVQEAGRRLVRGLAHGPRRYLVATASHCHALASVLDVAPA
ncbi:MAG TPA: hypothetical protein VII13_12345 [Vicinamibacteria bacterium]